MTRSGRASSKPPCSVRGSDSSAPRCTARPWSAPMPSPTPHTIQRFRNRPASAAPSAGTVYSPNCAGAIEANDARTTAAPEATSPASAQATTAERRGDQPSSSTPRSLSDPARSTSPARDQRKKRGAHRGEADGEDDEPQPVGRDLPSEQVDRMVREQCRGLAGATAVDLPRHAQQHQGDADRRHRLRDRRCVPHRDGTRRARRARRARRRRRGRAAGRPRRAVGRPGRSGTAGPRPAGRGRPPCATSGR